MEMGHILADGISGEGFLLLGCMFLVPAVLIVVIEGLVLKFMCGRPRRAFTASFVANLASALSGLVLMLVFYAGWRWMPYELDRYYTADRIYSLVRYAGYFLLSVAVEYAVVRRIFNPLDGVKRIGRGVLLGNAITYALLCPLLFWATSPPQDLTDLRSDSAWSADTTTTILYLDPATGYLMKTDPRRMHTETVVARHMTDYQVRPDLHSGLFLDGAKLWQFAGGKVTEVTTLVSSEMRGFPLISQVAMSPSGRSVAYTIPIRKKNDAGFEYEAGRRLILFDTVTAHSRPVNSSLEAKADAPVLVWTQHEAILLAISPWQTEIKQLTLAPDQPVADEKAGVEDVLVERTYGTYFRNVGLWPNHDFEVASDESPQLRAAVHNFLEQSLLLWLGADHKGAAQLELGVGVLAPSARWQFADVAVIPGSSLCVLEEDAAPMLYLIDADARRLGRLVPGRKMVLLTDKYDAGKYLRRESMTVPTAAKAHVAGVDCAAGPVLWFSSSRRLPPDCNGHG